MALRNQFMKPGETTFRQKLEASWKTPNETILKYIENTMDDRGFPNISNWKNYIEGKDEVELYSTLMYFLLNKKLPLPYANENENTIRKLFFKFKNNTIAPFVHHYDLDKPLIHRLSGNRNTQYLYDYNDWSMGYFPQHITANKISNYFAENERMKCEITNRESPTFLWTTEHGMSRLMDCIRRVGVDILNEKKLKKAFGYAGQVAAQFNVNTSKNIYNIVPGETIFDISSGWGDRLTGFYLSNKKTYIGTDPNLNMFEIYKKMSYTYEKWLGNDNPEIKEYDNYFELNGIKNVKIYCLPAEDIDYDEIPDIDLTFSSPPYFNKELYGKDSENEDNQSWKRYDTDDKWLTEFLYVILDKLIPKSKTTMINITDVGTDVRINRKCICDPMIERYKKDFVGIAGFQLSQNMNVVRYLNGYYTEPIWTFGRNFLQKDKVNLMDIFN